MSTVSVSHYHTSLIKQLVWILGFLWYFCTVLLQRLDTFVSLCSLLGTLWCLVPHWTQQKLEMKVCFVQAHVLVWFDLFRISLASWQRFAFPLKQSCSSLHYGLSFSTNCFRNSCTLKVGLCFLCHSCMMSNNSNQYYQCYIHLFLRTGHDGIKSGPKLPFISNKSKSPPQLFKAVLFWIQGEKRQIVLKLKNKTKLLFHLHKTLIKIFCHFKKNRCSCLLSIFLCQILYSHIPVLFFHFHICCCVHSPVWQDETRLLKA